MESEVPQPATTTALVPSVPAGNLGWQSPLTSGMRSHGGPWEREQNTESGAPLP